jgi:diguanylate cyclase (GGDEF)-like protein
VAGLANHDALTGAPNRRLLHELVPKVFANALRTNTKAAFLFMDLDDFKPINDKYGHHAGDEVLKIFTNRVLGLIRSSDIFARVGGDEFVLIMTDLKINSNAGAVAKKIIRETIKPINIRGDENFIGVSIGISIFPDDSDDTDILILIADEAMYRVKKKKKNSYAFFNEM